MKKGDLRRESILKTAETLFFTHGYENTSVQDVLDALSISKGGFYYYFESKLELLRSITQAHAEQRMERLRVQSAGKLSPIRRINLLLSEAILLNHDDPELNALLIKISYIDGDGSLRDELRTYLLPQLCALMDAAIEEGVSDGSLFTRIPGRLGRILLLMAYDANEDICNLLAGDPSDADRVMEAAELLNAYRECAESLLGARTGSVELFRLEQFLAAYRGAADRIERMKGETV